MRIIIGGVGHIGFGLARILSTTGHDVTVVDMNPDKLGLCTALDVQTILGSISSPDVLMQASGGQADMLIATTGQDEVNIVACQIAHALFDVTTKMAYLRAESYHKLEWQAMFGNDQLAVDVIISPEMAMVTAIMNRLSVPGALEVIPFVNESIHIVGVYIDRKCVATQAPLKTLAGRLPTLNVAVVGIVRKGSFLLAERGLEEEAAQLGDVVYFICPKEQTRQCLPLFSAPQDILENDTMNVLIVGGGITGHHAAAQLEQNKSAHVCLIEQDRKRAQQLASELEHTLVIHGSGLDAGILQEAGLSNVHTLLALTDDDHTNLISCALAKWHRCQRAIGLIRNDTLIPLVRHLGLDGFISPWPSTISVVLRYLRRGRIRAVHSLYDGAAEIHEVEITEASPLMGQHISTNTLPDGVCITALVRTGQIFIWERLGMRLEKGDILIICLETRMIEEAEKLFRSASSF